MHVDDFSQVGVIAIEMLRRTQRRTRFFCTFPRDFATFFSPVATTPQHGPDVSEPQKKLGEAQWVAVALLISSPVLYVLPYGPWTWIVIHGFQDVAYLDAGGFYAPLYEWLQADGGRCD